MIASIVILFLLQTELLCNETNLHLYFCGFQRELVLVTSHGQCIPGAPAHQ